MHPTLFPALLMHITDIEVHAICPPYCDFNALALARYHGARLQRRAILVVHTDNGLEGLGENIGDAPDGDALRAKYIGTSPFDWINARAGPRHEHGLLRPNGQAPRHPRVETDRPQDPLVDSGRRLDRGPSPRRHGRRSAPSCRSRLSLDQVPRR